jgi:hypothetical protein
MTQVEPAPHVRVQLPEHEKTHVASSGHEQLFPQSPVTGAPSEPGASGEISDVASLGALSSSDASLASSALAAVGSSGAGWSVPHAITIDAKTTALATPLPTLEG